MSEQAEPLVARLVLFIWGEEEGGGIVVEDSAETFAIDNGSVR